jgi:hypothetical protein
MFPKKRKIRKNSKKRDTVYLGQGRPFLTLLYYSKRILEESAKQRELKA